MQGRSTNDKRRKEMRPKGMRPTEKDLMKKGLNKTRPLDKRPKQKDLKVKAQMM